MVLCLPSGLGARLRGERRNGDIVLVGGRIEASGSRGRLDPVRSEGGFESEDVRETDEEAALEIPIVTLSDTRLATPSRHESGERAEEKHEAGKHRVDRCGIDRHPVSPSFAGRAG